jgi:hypothetical protein
MQLQLKQSGRYYMRNPIFALLALLFIYSSAAGQIKEAEATAIREALQLPASTSLTVIKSNVVPDGIPLRIYLAGAVSGAFTSDLSGWIEKWNKMDGPKYGTLEIATDLANSEVCLVRIIQTWPMTDRERTALEASASFLQIKGSAIALGYSYLIVRRPISLEIVWRQAEIIIEPGSNSAHWFSDELKKRLRARLTKRRK